ncbi:S-adenosyl-L-methionine-dependent methyltransferase [Naematelia encephala]|uniref:Histone-lysine N-methyltransferase, H3 lysine-79 specific n=1 Tax=Naematelia encephala TaxID=71784 RepID=A0A1Y2BHN0_9TREE|nr:S-adenosyl-L-methionine-dependent methyltransferase [Naematelia encephala]
MFSFFGPEDDNAKSRGPIVGKSIRKVTTPSTKITTAKPTLPSAIALKNGSSSKQNSARRNASSSKDLLRVQMKKGPSTPKRKRATERIESESEGSSDDGLENHKRGKVSSGTSTPFAGDEMMDRNVWRGGGEWEGFMPCEDVVRGIRREWSGPTPPGKGGLERYMAYFPQEGFENGDTLPSVELQHPAKGCRERFVLLQATMPREYEPVHELRKVLQMIFDHYIPAKHRDKFGYLLPTHLDHPSRMASPRPDAVITPPPDGPTETIGDALRKALAPNRRDGPGLIKAMDRFNAAMVGIQEDGSMDAHLSTKQLTRAEWSKLVDVVHEQAYSRAVGPYSHELEHHPKHPDEVAKAITDIEDSYGELRHDFMTKIIEQTGLGPDSVFVDLGSGVGNCVVQAALQAGCKSYGFELLPVPAHCARVQLAEARRRWAMWYLDGNSNTAVYEGDFRDHSKVHRLLEKADVVLVNNEVFPPSLNDHLTNMFLDLKDGAIIVSLKPFVPEGFRINESNCDKFAAVVRSTQHTYYQGWVSWKADSGTYYIQVKDKSMREKFEEDMKRGRNR